MEKNVAILRAVDHLRQALGDASFKIVDHWEADRTAVGFAHPQDLKRIVYIACSNPSHPAYSGFLERGINGGDESAFEHCGSFTGVRLDELVAIVSVHLRATS
jgi:hypothetical protein